MSETKGTLVVDVKDEYTYFTDEAPHVEGAKVVIMHPVSRQVIYEGVTGTDGLFTVGDIPEGYYAITVTAEKHDSYSNNLLVDPGKTNQSRCGSDIPSYYVRLECGRNGSTG